MKSYRLSPSRNGGMFAPLALALLTVVLGLGITACEDDSNDWEVDPSYNALFRSLEFKTSTIGSTEVLLHYTQVISANRYCFEFFTDSLEFIDGDYVLTDTIYADTLSIYADNSQPARVAYRTLFTELNGSTTYSVRMRGIDSTGVTSSYVEAAFTTTAEQIFTGVEKGINSFVIYWDNEKAATSLCLYLYDSASKTYDMQETISLSSSDLANGYYEVTGLSSGTTYKVEIWNNEALRGSYTVKTLGLKGAYVIEMPTGSTSDEVIDLASLCTDLPEGTSSVQLSFAAGQTYYLGNAVLPAVDNLLLTSTTTEEDLLPEVHFVSISLSTLMDDLNFEYLDLDFDGNNYIMVLSSYWASSIVFDGCHISNIGRTLVRPQSSDISIDLIQLNNCVLDVVGTNGYGMINMGSAANYITDIKITNCTMTAMGDQLMDLKAGVGTITMSDCTLYNGPNISKALSQIFRLDTAPESVVVSNTIISGSNRNSNMQPGYGDYTYLNFIDNNYLTSDVKHSREYYNITTLDLSAEELFEDPENGDFHIKQGAGFAAEGTAGDPRWY